MSARRWWRLAHAGRNPLVRSEDRFESLVLLFAVLVALIAVPFAALLGSETFAHERAAAAAASRHPASAVLLADAAPVAMDPQGIAVPGSTAVEATWQVADGSSRSGSVSAAQGTPAGTTVPIWLDDRGQPVVAPVPPSIAVVAAVTVAVLGWLTFAALVAGGFMLVRLAVDRRRYGRWTSDWARLPNGHSRF